MAALSESTGLFGRITKRNEKQRVKILLDGLKELPGHPILLLAAGLAQIDAGDARGARGSLRQAWEAMPANSGIVGQAMHELLHADGGDIVEELLPSARAIPGLLTEFWLDQARQAITCELDERWIDRFCEEALAHSALRRGDDSPVLAFIGICETLNHPSAPAALRSRWEARAIAETSHAGLSEFIGAQHAVQAGNRKKALDLLRKSRQLAEKANEPGAARYIREIEQQLAMPMSPLMNIFGDMDIDEVMRLFQQMNRRGRMRL
jgi:hypothetical protein